MALSIKIHTNYELLEHIIITRKGDLEEHNKVYEYEVEVYRPRPDSSINDMTRFFVEHNYADGRERLVITALKKLLEILDNE